MMNAKQLIALIMASVLILYIIVQHSYFKPHQSKSPPFINYETHQLYNKQEKNNDDGGIKKIKNEGSLYKDQNKKLTQTPIIIVINSPEIPPTNPSTNPPSSLSPNPPPNPSIKPHLILTPDPLSNLPTKFLLTTLKHEINIGKPLSRRSTTWPIKSNTPCNRKNKVRTGDEGRWYDYGRDDFVLYTYSALVDDRDSLEVGPLLRIIAISTDVVDMKNRPTMRCRFYFPIFQESKGRHEDLRMDVEVETKPERYVGMGWFLNGKEAREFIYTCPLPHKKQVLQKLQSTFPNKSEAFEVLEKNFTLKGDYLVPSWVGVMVGEEKDAYKYDDVTSCMPVETSKRVKKLGKFALCVQVAFGNIDPKKLVVWLELQKLLGVDNIGIYDQNIDKPAMEVLKFYADQGLVDLRRSDYIPHGTQQYMLHGSPVINDCMYRHLHTHEYLLVYDIDEVILPLKNQSSGSIHNFHDLLVELHSKYGGKDFAYVFRNRYFFSDQPADLKEPAGFDVLRYKLAAPVSNYGYSSKCMLNMQSCIQMHNHFCWGSTKAYSEMNPVDVSTNLASNQHYKKCHLKAECEKMIKDSKEFDAIDAYKSDLLKNVYKAVLEIRPRFKLAQLDDAFKEFVEKI